VCQAGPSLRYAFSEILENSAEHYEGDLETLEIRITAEELSENV
jgi:hypothetical protein